jgi:hypothetical protein
MKDTPLLNNVGIVKGEALTAVVEMPVLLLILVGPTGRLRIKELDFERGDSTVREG